MEEGRGGKDMMAMGKQAFVNLTTGEVQIQPTPAGLAEKLLGGRGMNMFYLNRFLSPSADPLSPENPLIIGAGLLTGTLAPNACRFNVSAVSPESGVLGDANCGGFFGPKMRAAGFDRLILLGRAPEPSYLYLEDGRLEIRPAEGYWGLNTRETQERLRADLGRDVQVACIGRAGERLVRFACVINGLKNAAGRGGMGAVMGSKNLKAVVARAVGGVTVADPAGMREKRKELTAYLQKSKIVQVLGKVGTSLLYEPSNRIGAIRTHNSQLNTFSESLNASEIEKYTGKMLACYGCVVHCRHRNLFGGEGPEYSVIGLLGANCGIDDPAEVVKLNNLVNDLGLDASSAGGIIPWAIELYQRGIIGPEVTGRELHFGDAGLVRDLLLDISERRGFGDILAESTRAVRRFGERSRDYLIAVKGLPQSDPHDCRYIKSFALGLAVASRGADHLRNRPTLEILYLPPELNARIYGREVDPDITSYRDKEVLVHFSENIFAVVDSLGICKFVCHGFNSPHLLKYEHFSELIRLATGLALSPEELREVGKRVVDLERYINLRLGVTRQDDTLPKRYFDDPMPLGEARGHHIDRAEFEGMLSRYYTLRGWDEEGRLPPGRVAELEALGTA